MIARVDPEVLESFMQLIRYMYRIAETYPHPDDVNASIDRVFKFLIGNG